MSSVSGNIAKRLTVARCGCSTSRGTRTRGSHRAGVASLAGPSGSHPGPELASGRHRFARRPSLAPELAPGRHRFARRPSLAPELAPGRHRFARRPSLAPELAPGRHRFARRPSLAPELAPPSSTCARNPDGRPSDRRGSSATARPAPRAAPDFFGGVGCVSQLKGQPTPPKKFRAALGLDPSGCVRSARNGGRLRLRASGGRARAGEGRARGRRAKRCRPRMRAPSPGPGERSDAGPDAGPVSPAGAALRPAPPRSRWAGTPGGWRISVWGRRGESPRDTAP